MTNNNLRAMAIAENCRDFSGKTPQFRKASPEDITWLKDVRMPEPIIEFFSEYEPVAGIESDGVYLVPIRKLRADNTQAVPGVAVNKYGWVVMATTISGDAYCVDTRNREENIPVYIVSHERGEDATFEDIKQHSHVVAKSFDEFLQKFAQKALPYDIEFAD